VIRPRPTRRHLGALAVLALGGGVAMAQAAGGSGAPVRPVRSAAEAAAVPASSKFAERPPQPVALPPAAATAPSRAPLVACEPRRRSTGGAPPSTELLDAFAILRRGRTAGDELPAAALKALRLRGLEPVAPEAARLLRSAGDVRAWVVPVPDVDRALPFACVRGASKPREGLAVVAVGGAPAGGGGALRELVRGIAPVATDPCAGPARDMLGVSGIVPDGVPAVFLTAPDGTAVRADVQDNGFSFVVPRTRAPAPHYVVWTGSDGAPHVQPVPVFANRSRVLCKRSRILSQPQVTPSGLRGCGPVALAAPVPVRRKGRTWLVPRAPRPAVVIVPRTPARRVPPGAPTVFVPGACSAAQVLGAPPSVPPPAVPVPGPRRPKPVAPGPPGKPGAPGRPGPP
jgi:hypothetical protein